jgi:hypothetical protein
MYLLTPGTELKLVLSALRLESVRARFVAHLGSLLPILATA